MGRRTAPFPRGRTGATENSPVVGMTKSSRRQESFLLLLLLQRHQGAQPADSDVPAGLGKGLRRHAAGNQGVQRRGLRERAQEGLPARSVERVGRLLGRVRRRPAHARPQDPGLPAERRPAVHGLAQGGGALREEALRDGCGLQVGAVVGMADLKPP